MLPAPVLTKLLTLLTCFPLTEIGRAYWIPGLREIHWTSDCEDVRDESFGVRQYRAHIPRQQLPLHAVLGRVRTHRLLRWLGYESTRHYQEGLGGQVPYGESSLLQLPIS